MHEKSGKNMKQDTILNKPWVHKKKADNIKTYHSWFLFFFHLNSKFYNLKDFFLNKSG